MATEVKETITSDHGRTNHNNNINNNTTRQQNHTLTNNNNNKLVAEQDERLLPQQLQQQQQKHKHHHRNRSEGSCSIEKLNSKKTTPKNGTVVSVPVIETIFTDSENTTSVNKTALMNGHSGGVHHNHTHSLNGLITNNQNNNSNHTAFKKISSPPVFKKMSGNGVVPTEHGMNLPVEEIESPDISRRRKYSNNHLYVPNGGC